MMTPPLKTPRLVLRPFAPGDWDALNAMLADTDAMQHMHFRSWNGDQRREWFDHCLAAGQHPSPEGMNWAVARQDTGEVIGWFGIGTSSDPANSHDISFGYALARPHWNQGYMTEVLRGVFAYEFETLGVPQLSANCRAPNVASARAMEKAGMRRVKSDYGADFEGNWSHRHHYVITRAEYEAGKEPGSHSHA
jgi:RimJ/RimL family protein N-acetyltransferase